MLRKFQWRFVSFRNSEPPRFARKSTRFPPVRLIPASVLDTCRILREAVVNILKRCKACFPQDNITGGEREELQRLSDACSFTVTPVDKGSSWMIVPRNHYEAEAYRQLTNEQFYVPLPAEYDHLVRQRVLNALSYLRAKGFLSKREESALQPERDFNLRNFYLLPKVHKDRSIWHFQTMPPGRPIVSDVLSVTRGCATLIEHFLAPLARLSRSYVRDSHHVISLLHNVKVHDSSFLGTLDIASLYTNIPTEDGIAAVSRAFQKHPDTKRPDLTLLTLLRLILTNNTFSFRGERFLQVQGTAMGCAFGSSYANIFLSEWEEKILCFPQRPSFWVRYIDDVFFIWDLDESCLSSFVELINSLFPTITVSLTFDIASIRFLDLTIYKSNSELFYRIGFKPTDTHAILPPTSYHPPQVFSSILFGQVYRWVTHSSSYSDFQATKKVVQPVWRQQGYTRSAIRIAVRRVFALTNQTPDDWRVGFYPCDCKVCSFGFYAKNIVNTFNNDSFVILHKLTCTSFNVVYLIVCKRCGFRYVGQTARPLHLRISQHLSDIHCSAFTSVANHFIATCTVQDFAFTALEHCPNKVKRLQKENVWIKRLRTLKPLGLNQELNSTNTLHLVVPYSSCSQRIARLCQRTLPPDVRTGVSYTRHRNLRSILTASNRSIS